MKDEGENHNKQRRDFRQRILPSVLLTIAFRSPRSRELSSSLKRVRHLVTVG